MKEFIATRIIVFGHIISSIGCTIIGHHMRVSDTGFWVGEDGAYYYCLLCGRYQG